MQLKIPCLVLFLCLLFCHFEAKAEGTESPKKTLNQYLQLRLQDADWKVYSALITWPDEPSWDCKWVAEKYDIGESKKTEKGRTIIPVVVKRLGLYCYDFSLSPDAKEVTINFELVKNPSGGWKVSEPTPDYPDIGADTLKKSLTASAENPNESAERRAKFAATLQKLVGLLTP